MKAPAVTRKRNAIETETKVKAIETKTENDVITPPQPTVIITNHLTAVNQKMQSKSQHPHQKQ